jgi:hypothetical protein
MSREEHARLAAKAITSAERVKKYMHGAIAEAKREYALGEGGEFGGWISGGFKEHWPWAVKDAIRNLFRQYSGLLNLSHQHYEASGLRTPFNQWIAAVRGEKGSNVTPALQVRIDKLLGKK